MRRPLLPELPRPLLFAHRGLSARYPENTMRAFAAAVEAGVPGIELDVHLTKDGALAVFHDDDTKRIAGIGLSLESSTFRELSALDIGSWKGEAFAGERIPRLEDVLSAFGDKAYFDIEIKSRTTDDRGLEAALARTLDGFKLGGRCLVSSFNPFAIRRFRAVAAEIPTAIIWSDSKELYWFLRHGEGRWLGAADIAKPDHGLVRGPVRGARPTLPWTVDDAAEASRLIGLGAAGLISNRPDELGIRF